MKNIGIVLFMLGFFLKAQSAPIAIKICHKSDLTSIKDKNLKVITVLKQENFIIVESDIENRDLASFCYYTPLKTHKDKFSFNTNTILIKTTQFVNDSEIRRYNLKANPFIPNVYTLESTASNEAELQAVIQSIQAEAWCESARVNQIFTLESTSNDPIYSRQWSIENTGSVQQYNGTPGADMSVDSAWTISEGDPSIVIAILDSGVDTLHEDLVDNLLPGYDAFSTDSSDTRGFPTPNFSSDGHGTACAGIAAAASNNNKGVAGIAPNCKLVPIRIFYYKDYGSGIGVQPTTSTLALLNGSAYAWRYANADIMSTSAGLSNLFIAVLEIDVTIIDNEILDAFFNGRNGFGVPMFFSAGNDDINDVLWPGDLFTTIAVGASSMCDERKNPSDCSSESWGSSFGKMLDIVAPGVKIASTDMSGTNGYENSNYTNTFNGTSASCPNAAGVGALILSVNDSLHARDVKAILNITADRVGGYDYDSTTVHGTWNEEMGHGRINAFEALKLAETYETTVSVKDIIELNRSLSVYPNPSNGAVTIINESNQEQDIIVYDVLGKQLPPVRVEAFGTRQYLFKQKGYYILKNNSTDEVVKVLVR